MAQNYSYIAKELIEEGKKQGASSESLLKYLRDRDTKQGELPTILQLAKTDLTPFVNPTPLKKNEMITTGNLTEGDVATGETVAPVIRRTFDQSLNEFDTQRVKIQRDDSRDKMRTLINLRRLQTPEVQELISGKSQLSLRQAIAKDKAIGNIMEKAIASGDTELLKKAIPKKDVFGISTIQMTPQVKRIFDTPEGREAIKKVATDLYSEGSSFLTAQEELNDAVEKAQTEAPKQGGFGNKFLEGIIKKNESPKKVMVEIPETGESLNVGEKAPMEPKFDPRTHKKQINRKTGEIRIVPL